MKETLCLAMFIAVSAAAQQRGGKQPGDRAPIGEVIATLNETQPPDGLFTADGNGSSEFQRLPKANSKEFRIFGPLSTVVPTVTISHEPWGEAQINFPLIELRAPYDSIVFVTPDVALAEGSYIYEDSGTRHVLPLLFVMQKDGGVWKIASIRVLASR